MPCTSPALGNFYTLLFLFYYQHSHKIVFLMYAAVVLNHHINIPKEKGEYMGCFPLVISPDLY